MTRDNWLACVATTLKTSRAKAGLTQCALAARIDRSTGTVDNWEAGRVGEAHRIPAGGILTSDILGQGVGRRDGIGGDEQPGQTEGFGQGHGLD